MASEDTAQPSEEAAFDAVEQARKLPDDKKTRGTELFVNAGLIFDKIVPTLKAGALVT